MVTKKELINELEKFIENKELDYKINENNWSIKNRL